MKLTLCCYFVAAFALLSSIGDAKSDSSMYFGNDGATTSGYLDWLDRVGRSKYTRTQFLPSMADKSMGVALHWITNETHIQLAAAAKVGPEGWLGIGLAESGNMKGADIAMFSSETVELVDSHNLDTNSFPTRDECQNWELLDSVTDDEEYVIFEAVRLLDTGDSQDRAIKDDRSGLMSPSRIIASWGESGTPQYHGSDRVAQSSIRFFGPDAGNEVEYFRELMEEEEDGSWFMGAVNFTIPAQETTYEYFCVSAEDMRQLGVPIDDDLHTIGMEPILDPDTIKYVHHFIVYAWDGEWNSSLPCDPDDESDEEAFPGSEIVYTWAPGDVPQAYPSNMGGPLGEGGFKSFRVEIHYDNPNHDEGQIDSSGVKFHYTTKKRPIDIGILQIGDPFLSLHGELVAPDGGISRHIFACNSSCTSTVQQQPITVMRESLHMHQAGRMMTNVHYRNNKEIRRAVAQYYDFDQQGSMDVVQRHYDVLPGDAFKVTCDYESNNNEVFGLGSANEMCIAFLTYYPRLTYRVTDGDGNEHGFPYMCGRTLDEIGFDGCGATHEQKSLSDKSEMGRVFGTPSTTCGPTVVAVGDDESNEPISPTDAMSSAVDGGSSDAFRGFVGVRMSMVFTFFTGTLAVVIITANAF